MHNRMMKIQMFEPREEEFLYQLGWIFFQTKVKHHSATSPKTKKRSNAESNTLTVGKRTRGEAVKDNMKLWSVGIICITAVLAVGVLIVRSNVNQSGNLSHPRDAVLEARFKQHEADLELLAAMSQADSRVVRITNDFTWLDNNAGWPRPESELGFSEERWDEYRKLFKEIGLEGGITREEHGEVTYFIFSSKGLVTHGTEKGYAFSNKELTPTAESLDDVTRMPKGKSVVFKKLKEHWYLFYMSA